MPSATQESAYDQLVAAIDQACLDKKDTAVVEVAEDLGMAEVASTWKTAYWQYELKTETEGTITLIHGWNDPASPNPGSSEAEIFELSRTQPPASYRNQYE
ncbi:hypothetical protein [Bordetella sp. N]|uniref:hypothetical protein n=1 Tax=Bordetella sp. N TaxID=1746199 RepID=UPI00070EBE0D|nr:hypothetical protein [Bordetella sp. N]ALM86128.1 hypothetical protein ASB57_27085 [Bordetella sp. N]